jgi:hypothetical protein
MMQWAERFGLWLARPIRRWRKQRRLEAVKHYQSIYPWLSDAEIERRIFGNNI